MQFTKLLVAAAAFASASAQTYRFTNSNFGGITVGQPFNITWAPATGSVTIKLKSGLSTAQTLVSTIVSGAVGGSFEWIPTADTVPGQMYNLELDHDSDIPNYSVQFTIAGGSGSASSSVSSVVSSTSTGSSVTSSASASTSSGTASSSSSSASSTGSASGSSTSAKATTTASKTSTSTSSSSSSTPTTNAAAQYASPFAFALMSFFAIAALN